MSFVWGFLCSSLCFCDVLSVVLVCMTVCVTFLGLMCCNSMFVVLQLCMLATILRLALCLTSMFVTERETCDCKQVQFACDSGLGTFEFLSCAHLYNISACL